MIKVGDTGWQGLEGLGADLIAEILPDAVNAVHDAADMFANEIKSTLTGARTGRVYQVTKTRSPGARKSKRKKATRQHVASAPGEAPAVLYGALRNSVGRDEVRVVDGVDVQANVGVGLGVKEDSTIAENYARRLEYGGVDKRGVRILPRPYIEPTRLRVEPRIEALFASVIGSTS